jgi:hypothetical protein
MVANPPRPSSRRPGRPVPRALAVAWALLIAVLAAPAARAADPALAELARRLDRLESQNARLVEQNRALADEVGAVRAQNEDLRRRVEGLGPRGDPAVAPAAAPDPTPPVPAPSPPVTVVPHPPAPATGPGRFLVGDYDDDRGAFVLVRPRDADRVPFELRVDLFTQARYMRFLPSAGTWTDSTGVARPVRELDSIEVTRNFVQFSGFAIDPKLQYTAILFSSTALNDTVYLGWINYAFSKAFDLRVGNWVIPGTREWYESFRYTMGADRLMATTFFRPNISPGIWAQGEPLPNVRYVAMLANSFNRFRQGIERQGSGRAFGGTVWWEPAGEFGPGPSDLEGDDRLRPRLGTSLVASREQNQGFAAGAELANPEDTILRLSDGTPLFRPDALGPGVGLRSAGVLVWTLDGAVKYRGLGLSGEYFFRWLGDFDAVGAAPPRSTLFDQGALVQGGYFLVPGKVELFARSSFVTGPFGSGDEWGGGLNWYVRGTRDWRLTVEALRINHSPAENILTGYRAGASGTLLQLQWFTDF